MTVHRLNIFEGAQPEDRTSGIPQQNCKTQYTVVEALFKHGRVYNIGELIELDEETARLFIENNEIKEIE